LISLHICVISFILVTYSRIQRLSFPYSGVTHILNSNNIYIDKSVIVSNKISIVMIVGLLLSGLFMDSYGSYIVTVLCYDYTIILFTLFIYLWEVFIVIYGYNGGIIYKDII